MADDDDSNPYKYLKGSENLTVNKLNLQHNVNYKSISMGRLMQESSSNNQYALRDCSTLLAPVVL